MYEILEKIFNNSQLDIVCDSFQFSQFMYLNSFIDSKDLDRKEFSLNIYNFEIEDFNSIPIDNNYFDIYSFGSELEEIKTEIFNSLELNQSELFLEISDIYKNREDNLMYLIKTSQSRDIDLKKSLEDNINFGLEGLIGNLILSKNLNLMKSKIKSELFISKSENGYNSKKELNVLEFYKTLFNYSITSTYRDFKFFNDQIKFYSNLGLNIQKIDYKNLGKYISEKF